ncbi:Ribulose-5-phosphate 4-epimerase/Fuculose-1-phosphate aldolase [Tistlia consotensis]|uniref:Ribulose-5-phosphate 4-epimerase/Fuculose-1-phosphate aldolase n=1 Tax=Tistlia consotensis USBA 355 TaxID=560819 RepID=A0A1Y6CSY8_9PROT|nr:class II aldolase/adducin family protein [Tistlia consotensis]SMF77147.1 Ribulose-5-phosphate 4-epimerase/Fuculose-1-phosphate aldolase [Tistlia consotensis USBA 355]SNS14305.1 Ribulose-5-phosphate 4-epimerase/Fuculose-1-phosphate aldolase [Tistlia consotensis]
MDSRASASTRVDSNSAALAEAEREMRLDLAAAYRLVALHGLDDSIFTHISARLPGSHDRFLLNAYGLRFDEVTAGSLVTVDLDGEILDDPTGWGINPAGFTIHSAIHAARPDVTCVLHTHTPAGVAVSCQRDGLLPLNQWSLQFHGRLAYHDYESIALDLDERGRLAADLGERPAMILRNHGLLTVGRSVAEAWKLMHNLERSCVAQLRLQASGAPLVQPSEAVAKKTAGQYAAAYDAMESGAAADREWAAFRRLVERRCPGYDA